jgi:mannose-1-phosphate guanylyltransferase|tara:strand:- start:4793 stop:6196 length:1404 start_codon:yes stop_codon:yes gene_type:complete
MDILGVIMAGGSGSRLWPLSRANHPKQFLALDSNDTMLQATAKRLECLQIENTVTICNEGHRFFVAEQLRQINKLGSIILEPVSRNTAPAIALAALCAPTDVLLLVLAADHVIGDETAFRDAILTAVPLAEAGKLVTFGIAPNEPHTGYGYIRSGVQLGGGYTVDAFVEKPSSEVANGYLEDGGYYWNSGMFLFKASRYLEELEKFCPEIFSACAASVNETAKDLDFTRINVESFTKCPNESIDYAVMEKTKDAIVVPINAGWNDIGSWSSLWDISAKDPRGNVSKGDVMLHDSDNSYVRSENKLVVTLGVDNLVIVETKDAVLVAQKDKVENLKEIIDDLKSKSRPEWDLNREVIRPWGKFDSIDSGPRYQVKRITVNSGAKLSVQMHHHRAEHWIVVSGTAQVTKGSETILLTENESIYLPLGIIHALENPGKMPLELIEVQSGAYLGEDDIVRFEDRYGRDNRK